MIILLSRHGQHCCSFDDSHVHICCSWSVILRGTVSNILWDIRLRWKLSGPLICPNPTTFAMYFPSLACALAILTAMFTLFICTTQDGWMGIMEDLKVATFHCVSTTQFLLSFCQVNSTLVWSIKIKQLGLWFMNTKSMSYMYCVHIYYVKLIHAFKIHEIIVKFLMWYTIVFLIIRHVTITY